MSRKLLAIYSIFYKNYKFNFLTGNGYVNKHNYITWKLTTLRPVINHIQYSTYEHKIVTYEDLKEISSRNDDVLIIDVREPEELSETGILPSSINIPLGNLVTVFKDMSDEEFLKVYRRKKPDKNLSIIFSCKSGKRSDTACDISHQLGFRNVKNYIGGWTEWSERNMKLGIGVTCSSLEENNERYRKVSFEDVNKVKDDPNYLIIDVREPSELVEHGSIPGSINIPLGDLESVLTNVSGKDFKEKYNREKPDKNFNIIFSCRSGRRSRLALEKAIALDYKNGSDYSGSWLDWEKHTKKSI